MSRSIPVHVAAAGAALLLGCGVDARPPPAAPAREIPAGLEISQDPPPPGSGRVVLDANGERARVFEITGPPPGDPSESTVGVRPVCTTPCVVDLPYGPHPLVFQSVANGERQSEAAVDVGARAKVLRHSLGERSDGGGARTAGAALVVLGVIAATTGAILWAAGGAGSSDPGSLTSSGSTLASAGQTLAGGGAGAALLGIPLLLIDRPVERQGTTTEWTLPSATGREAARDADATPEADATPLPP